MDIGAGLSAASSAISIAKTLNDLDRNYDVAQFKIRITELLEALSETKLALLSAREMVAEQEAEIKQLRQSKSNREDLIADGAYKYLPDDSGNKTGFPVCPKCDQVDGRIIQLVQNAKIDAAKCPACKGEYQPVTCYLDGGDTLVGQRDERRRQIQANNDRQIAAHRGRNSWMV